MAADGIELRFSGYGTLAGTYADTGSSGANYRSSWRQERGSADKVDMGVDSRFGGQLNLKLDDTLSAAAQLLASRRDGRQAIDVEWLYGQAQVTEDLALRVGRMVLPAYMLSDVRNVGYAQHWVRTPAEVYLWFPVTAVDGIQALYRTQWGNTQFVVQPTIGQAQARMYFDGAAFGTPYPIFGNCDFRDVRSLNLSAEHGPWTFRIGRTVMNSRQTWENASFLPKLNFRYTFTGVGAQYDDGSLLVMAEMVRGETDIGTLDSRSNYASIGYRIGAWMPYVTRSYLRNVGTRISHFPSSVTTAAGLRWDAWRDVAIKAQIDRSRLTGQQFIRVAPNTNLADSVNVYTLAVDYVF